VVIFITLLAGFIPRLQVTFFALLEDCYPGRLAVKDRDKTPRITGVILIILVSDFQSLLGEQSIPVNSFLFLSYPEKAYKKIRVLSFAIA
jgi:hypothetical protein